MSSTVENIAPLLTPRQESSEKRRRRKRPYKARVATKVKWALGDAMSKTISLQEQMRRILEWLEEQRSYDAGDVTRRARLGDLGHLIAHLALDVSELERILGKTITECKPEQQTK